MRSKTYLIAIILFCISIISCKQKTIEIKLDKSYSGPCVIFILDNDKTKDEKNVSVENGVGIISENKTSYPFKFKSNVANEIIEIVPIGNNEAKDANQKYIYQLVKGETHLAGFSKKIKNITFYVGTPNEFSEWNKVYNDELEYLEKKGVDWKKFYSTNIQ